MAERVRVLSQLEKVQNSITMIDMHRATIEGTSLDISILETIKVILWSLCFEFLVLTAVKNTTGLWGHAQADGGNCPGPEGSG